MYAHCSRHNNTSTDDRLCGLLQYIPHLILWLFTIPDMIIHSFYTKLAKYGSTDQLLSTNDEFVIRYKPNSGHFGLDTFQVVYFYPIQKH